MYSKKIMCIQLICILLISCNQNKKKIFEMRSSDTNIIYKFMDIKGGSLFCFSMDLESGKTNIKCNADVKMNLQIEKRNSNLFDCSFVITNNNFETNIDTSFLWSESNVSINNIRVKKTGWNISQQWTIEKNGNQFTFKNQSYLKTDFEKNRTINEIISF